MVFLNFYASTVKFSYEFLHTVKLFTWGLKIFYDAMMKFLFLFSNAIIEK